LSPGASYKRWNLDAPNETGPKRGRRRLARCVMDHLLGRSFTGEGLAPYSRHGRPAVTSPPRVTAGRSFVHDSTTNQPKDPKSPSRGRTASGPSNRRLKRRKDAGSQCPESAWVDTCDLDRQPLSVSAVLPCLVGRQPRLHQSARTRLEVDGRRTWHCGERHSRSGRLPTRVRSATQLLEGRLPLPASPHRPTSVESSPNRGCLPLGVLLRLNRSDLGPDLG